jgi:hypothetical protein
MQIQSAVSLQSKRRPTKRKATAAFTGLMLVLALSAASVPVAAQDKPAQDKPTQDKPAPDKPALVVNTFTTASGLSWPYDATQLQLQTIVELKRKDGQYFNVADKSDDKATATYTLSGEILEWHPGNRATRMFVGMGSGRETAKIHYWLTNQSGKKVFEHTDTIRQAFWGNAYANSVGQLAQPFADKIAKRLAEAKLAAE